MSGAERMLETTRSSIVGNFDILFHKHKKDKINLLILMNSLFHWKEIFKFFFVGETSLFRGPLCGLSRVGGEADLWAFPLICVKSAKCVDGLQA